MARLTAKALAQLAAIPSLPTPVSKIAGLLGCPKSTARKHMRVFLAKGVVSLKKIGKVPHYSLRTPPSSPLGVALVIAWDKVQELCGFEGDLPEEDPYRLQWLYGLDLTRDRERNQKYRARLTEITTRISPRIPANGRRSDYTVRERIWVLKIASHLACSSVGGVSSRQTWGDLPYQVRAIAEILRSVPPPSEEQRPRDESSR